MYAGSMTNGMLNAVFQYQFGEQSMIRYGKGRSGLKGRTMPPNNELSG